MASPLTASVLAGLVAALVGLLFLLAGLTGQLALSSFYAGSARTPPARSQSPIATGQ